MLVLIMSQTCRLLVATTCSTYWADLIEDRRSSCITMPRLQVEHLIGMKARLVWRGAFPCIGYGVGSTVIQCSQLTTILVTRIVGGSRGLGLDMVRRERALCRPRCQGAAKGGKGD